MTTTNINQRATFTNNTLEPLKAKFPDMIRKQHQKMVQMLQRYNHLIQVRRDNDGRLFIVQKQEEELIQKHTRTIKFCFLIASDSGKKTKQLYFPGTTPYKLLTDSLHLYNWLKSVQTVMAHPENNHIDEYSEELKKLEDQLGEIIALKNQITSDQKNLTAEKDTNKEALKESYQTLKYYLKGWLTSQKLKPSAYFLDIKDRSKRKKQKKASTPILPSPLLPTQ